MLPVAMAGSIPLALIEPRLMLVWMLAPVIPLVRRMVRARRARL